MRLALLVKAIFDQGSDKPAPSGLTYQQKATYWSFRTGCEVCGDSWTPEELWDEDEEGISLQPPGNDHTWWCASCRRKEREDSWTAEELEEWFGEGHACEVCGAVGSHRERCFVLNAHWRKPSLPVRWLCYDCYCLEEED